MALLRSQIHTTLPMSKGCPDIIPIPLPSTASLTRYLAPQISLISLDRSVSKSSFSSQSRRCRRTIQHLGHKPVQRGISYFFQEIVDVHLRLLGIVSYPFNHLLRVAPFQSLHG